MEKWTLPAAAASLAAGYVHYAIITEWGGTPGLAFGWVLLAAALLSVNLKSALD